MVKLAMRNSLIETKNQVVSLDEIEEMKVFYPTAEDFKSPMAYIQKLVEEGAEQYGCIKIIPPKEFKPPVAFDQNSDQKLPTRY